MVSRQPSSRRPRLTRSLEVLRGESCRKSQPQGPAAHGQAQGAQAAQDAAVAVGPDDIQGPEPEEAAPAPPPGLKVDQPRKGETQEDEGKDVRPHVEVMGAGGQDQGQQQRGQGQAEAGA